MAMVIIVMSQMTMLSSTSSGVKRKFQAQDLEGQIIHDDGSSSHGRCNVEEFMQGSLKQYENVVIKGVTGSKTNPFLGVLRDGNETLKNVILLILSWCFTLFTRLPQNSELTVSTTSLKISI
jgi:hypothetical protein